MHTSLCHTPKKKVRNTLTKTTKEKAEKIELWKHVLRDQDYKETSNQLTLEDEVLENAVLTWRKSVRFVMSNFIGHLRKEIPFIIAIQSG